MSLLLIPCLAAAALRVTIDTRATERKHAHACRGYLCGRDLIDNWCILTPEIVINASTKGVADITYN